MNQYLLKSTGIALIFLSILIIGCNTVVDSSKEKETNTNQEQEIKARSHSQYQLIQLEQSLGNTFGLSINDNLQVAGYGNNKSMQSPLKWVNTKAIELGGFDPSFPFGEAEGINAANFVVGRSTLPNRRIHAFIWSERSGMNDLGTLPNGGQSQAYAINTYNEVVGWSFANSFSEQRAFLWDDKNGMQNLGTLGGDMSAAYSINDQSIVTGNSTTKNGEKHAFIWNYKNGMSDLGTLGGSFSVATDINNNNQIVGWSETESGDIEAFIWEKYKGMRSLGKYFKRYGKPHAINDEGVIVGEYLTTASVTHAFTLDSNTGFFTDLGNISGPNSTPSYARDINNNGDVTGYLFSSASNSNVAVIWKK